MAEGGLADVGIDEGERAQSRAVGEGDDLITDLDG
jgi:hypothetical protein